MIKKITLITFFLFNNLYGINIDEKTQNIFRKEAEKIVNSEDINDYKFPVISTLVDDLECRSLPLHSCIIYKCPDMFKRFLNNKNINLETTDSMGRTPLLFVIKKMEDFKLKENLDMIETLIKAGANINACNSDGDTPLHKLMMYMYYNQQRCVYLVKEHEPIQAQYLRVIKLLLQYGADLNIKNNQSNTAFLMAAKNFYDFPNAINLEIFKLLVFQGADTTIKDGYGNSYLDYVKTESYSNIRNKLKEIVIMYNKNLKTILSNKTPMPDVLSDLIIQYIQ